MKPAFLARLVQKAANYFAVSGYGGSWTRLYSSEPCAGAWQRNIVLDRRDQLLAQSAIYACATRIANDVAKMGVNLVEKTDDGIWQAVERESPFWRPLRRPNLVQNRIQFFTLWMLCKLLHGNAFVLKERDDRGVVARLYVLPPDGVTPLVAPDGSVFYRYSVSHVPGLDNETGVVIPASEVIHDLMNPIFHPLCGVSPLYACAMSASQSSRIQEHSAAFFQNRAMPSGVLVSPGELKDAEAAKYKDAWEKGYSGVNSGRIAVLGGGLKYEPITQTMEQSQLVEQLRWGVEDVARAFSMPLHKIGAGPMPTSNNVEVLNRMYYDDCLQIHIESIELCLDEGLGLTNVVGQTLGTEFDLDSLLRMDQAALIEAESKAVGSGIKAPNESRRRVNLPPVEGGETPYLQEQNWALSMLAQRSAPTRPMTDVDDDPPAQLPPPGPQKASTADVLKALMPEHA